MPVISAASAHHQGPAATILDAAFDEFIAVGVRRSTMDGIARAASISRASLYRYYSSKEEVFRAVAQRVWVDVLAQSELAWELHDSLDARLVHVVNVKLDMWVDICAGSHGAEMVDSESKIAGDITREGRSQYRRLIQRLIDEARGPQDVVLAGANISSRTIAEIIESWIQATKLRPGSLRSRHRYVNESVRFFTQQIAAT